MRVLLVAGARPNFVKVAPVLHELERRGETPVLVHTGQHYDVQMSQAFFRDLALPPAEHHLGVGSDSHARQTARVMEAFEPVLLAVRPHWVVVVGDVNSTLACALVAAKLKDELGCRVAHVEAGLRSDDWRMPEEINRVLTDRLADLLLTPSHDVRPRLLAEGIDPRRIVFVGNVMIDTLRAQLPRARALDLPRSLGLPATYAVATLHRPSNVDAPEALEAVLDALAELAREMPVVLPLHPRTRRRIDEFRLHDRLGPLHALDSLGYLEMLSLTDRAALVLTDSGGLQEETTVLGIPCVTLREQTERPVTIREGTNRLVPWPPTASGVYGAAIAALRTGRRADVRIEGWDGAAAVRIVDALLEHGANPASRAEPSARSGFATSSTVPAAVR